MNKIKKELTKEQALICLKENDYNFAFINYVFEVKNNLLYVASLRSMDLSNKEITQLPFKLFSTLNFTCMNGKFKDLDFLPLKIHGDLTLSNNPIDSFLNFNSMIRGKIKDTQYLKPKNEMKEYYNKIGDTWILEMRGSVFSDIMKKIISLNSLNTKISKKNDVRIKVKI